MNRIFKESFSALLPNNKLLLLFGPKGLDNLNFVTEILSEKSANFNVIDLSNPSIRGELNKLKFEELIWYVNQAPFAILNECEHLKLLSTLADAVLDQTVTSSLILIAKNKSNLDIELVDALENAGLSFYFPAPTFYEYTIKNGLSTEDKGLEKRLIYGNYFGLDTADEEIELQLKERAKIMLDGPFNSKSRVNKNDILRRTIQVLAHHIGQSLSYHQISELIQVDNETVERYIHILIDAHLIYKIPCYSTDQRYELKKTHIFIFMDNGIRNAVINNFNALTMRIDLDALWKNWLISERIKWNTINRRHPKYYFWRSHTRQQIDLIEIGEKGMQGFNFRFEKKKMIKTAPLYTSYYPSSAVHTVNKSTYLTFLTKK
jgi:predicted AAA+ superfamily ATPase